MAAVSIATMTANGQAFIGLQGEDAVLGARTTLAASPYLTSEHLLDLSTLDIQSRLLALALTTLAPVRPDYATSPYQLALNWDNILTSLASLATEHHVQWERQSFYVVEFRSRLKQDIDGELLFTLDKQSHREATESGGLLKYWYGTPDAARNNLATCKQKPSLITSFNINASFGSNHFQVCGAAKRTPSEEAKDHGISARGQSYPRCTK